MSIDDMNILIVEDGNEYLDNLSRFVPGPRYTQAHSGAEAIEILKLGKTDVVYLDMRFDRIPHGDLMGEHAAATSQCNGDPVRAWRHLQNNQGLYILAAMLENGFGNMPTVLAYDFSREKRRYEHLSKQYPALRWVSDAITPEQIRSILTELHV